MKRNLMVLSTLLVCSIFVLGLNFGYGSANSQVGESIQYHSSVCVSINDEDPECSHNLLTDAGKEHIENLLRLGTGSAVDYIALCNATAGCTDPAAGDTVLDNEYAAGGLSRTQGSTGSNGGSGNWSVWNTFTATEDDVVTNMTGLLNASSSGTLFAENSFTSATLQTNDQLTINWTIWVS